jgi:hypothetical protein
MVTVPIGAHRAAAAAAAGAKSPGDEVQELVDPRCPCNTLGCCLCDCCVERPWVWRFCHGARRGAAPAPCTAAVPAASRQARAARRQLACPPLTTAPPTSNCRRRVHGGVAARAPAHPVCL